MIREFLKKRIHPFPIFLGLILFIVYSIYPIHVTEAELAVEIQEVFTILDRVCPNKNYYHPRHTYFKMERLMPGILGQCERNALEYTITIDSFRWEQLTKVERFTLMAHEITHCALHVDHIYDRYNYMYPQLIRDPILIIVELQLIENAKSVCKR